jgi:hypothetical protein
MQALVKLLDMKPVQILAVLLLTLGMTFLIAQYHQTVSANKTFSPSPFASFNPSPSDEPSVDQVLSVATVGPKVQLTPTPQPTLASTPTSNSGLNLDRFVYPGAKINSKNSTQVNLSSTADSNTITNWYKEQISSLGFNVNSFVMTTNNDNVLNQLVAAKQNQQIKVEIKKGSGEKSVQINVTTQ